MAQGTLTQMFQSSVQRFGQKAAMTYKRDGAWHTVTYDGYGRYVRDLANGLMALGIEPGDKVAVWSANRPEWSISDFATMHAGGSLAPIYPTLLEDHVQYIVNDCAAKVFIVENAAKLEAAMRMLPKTKSVRYVVCMETVPEGYRGKGQVLGFDDLYAKGRAYAKDHPTEFDARWQSVAPGGLATLIYTSGTTGMPKGVMLTHSNLHSNATASAGILDIGRDDTHLSFLPLCHSYERTSGHYIMVLVGATVAFAESIEKVPQNLQEVRPTVIQSVPRLYEKMYAGVHAKVAQAPPKKQKIFAWAKAVGLEYGKHREAGKSPSIALRVKYALADRLVFSKLRMALVGGRARVLVTGAAALNPDVERFFTGMGLPILQGYGLTESSPVITVNRADNFRFGSIGLPIPGVEVKIADDGELLARGPNIMQGYYNLPKETKEALDEEGWLHTGDIVRKDDDGFYYITDRKKELFKTAYGKYIAPQPIENAFKLDPLVGMPIVLGAERKYAAALIVPNWEALEPWAKKEGLSYRTRAELVALAQVKAAYQAIVDRVNERLSQYEKIKAFALLDRDLTIDAGELTPTLKVKRRVVHDNFKAQIEGMFQD